MLKWRACCLLPARRANGWRRRKPLIPRERRTAWRSCAGQRKHHEYFVSSRQPLPNRVTSEVPVIQEEQPVRASCASFSLLAVDRPTSGWRQAQDKGIGPMVSDGIQPSAAPEDRTYAQRFRPPPTRGVAAPAFSE